MIVDHYDAFLLDLDGVVFKGDEPVTAAAASLERLRAEGKRLVFVTNNSSRTPDQVVEHLAGVGIAAVPEEVESSALVTASVLAARGTSRVYVVGERGLRDAIADRGIQVVTDEAPVDAVAVGWDRTLSYETLRIAVTLVQDGATLIASNADPNYPAPDGHRWPGAGAILAAIEAAVPTRAEVIGKPNAPLLQAALARAGGGRPLMVGDRLDTDILGAVRLGWDSLLVLTGISSRADLSIVDYAPTYVAEDLSGLFEHGASD